MEQLATPVSLAGNVNYLWKPNDPRDAGLWQNVEFVNNKFNNFRIVTMSDQWIPQDTAPLLSLRLARGI